MIKKHISHLLDSHYKVAQACMISLNLIIENYAEHIINFLEKILTNVKLNT